jgi:hypothetical protein
MITVSANQSSADILRDIYSGLQNDKRRFTRFYSFLLLLHSSHFSACASEPLTRDYRHSLDSFGIISIYLFCVYTIHSCVLLCSHIGSRLIPHYLPCPHLPKNSSVGLFALERFNVLTSILLQSTSSIGLSVFGSSTLKGDPPMTMAID